MLRCIFGSNLEILTSIGKYGMNNSKWGKFFNFVFNLTMKFQGQSPHYTRGNLTKICYPFGPNLVILGWTSHGLPHKQARGSQAHTTHTDAGNDNNRRPKTGLGENDGHDDNIVDNENSDCILCNDIYGDRNCNFMHWWNVVNIFRLTNMAAIQI